MAIIGGAETRTNSYQPGTQHHPRITALSDGGWVVTWQSTGQDGSGGGVYQQAYNTDGSVRGVEVQVNSSAAGDQSAPQITALNDGRWAVTWQSANQSGWGWEVCQQVYNADGSAQGGEVLVNSHRVGDQSAPQITTLTDGGWVVTWQSFSQDGSDWGVYQQVYNANGSARGGEAQVNSNMSRGQYVPQIAALADGGWVVTWQSFGQDAPGAAGVYQQAYNANGSVRGVETRVNSHVGGPQQEQQITALKGGGWVVTWQSHGQDGSGWGVYQQAYDANGSVRGGEVRVTSHATGDQSVPQITALAGGGWVVTWQSFAQDGSGSGVYQQAYDAAGSARGGEIQVNSHTTGDQSAPQITALAGGGWVVTWQSDGQDGADYGVYQQVYNADGSAQGGEVQVNDHVSGVQGSPRVTALEDGGWVVTWQSDGQDGSGFGVFQRVFHIANDAPAGADRTIGLREDASHGFTAADFGFSDGDGNVLSAVIVATLPTKGTLTVNGAAVTAGQSIAVADLGGLVWTPAVNTNGAASFTFKVVDNGGTAGGGQDIDQSPNTIIFDVLSVNDVPSGADKTIVVGEDGSHSFAASDFGFTDADGNGLSAVVVATLPANGTLRLNGVSVTAGQSIAAADLSGLVWKPAANANGDGLTSFTFKVVDNGGTADGGANTDQSANTITFDVTPVNDAPVFSATTPPNLSIAESSTNGAEVGTVRIMDPDGPAATFSLTDNAGGRFAIDAATGKITVLNRLLLDFEQARSHQITVKVSDGGATISKTLVVDLADVSPETVLGSSGSDSFVGGSGNDKFAGYGGNDRLSGGAGNDTLNGGAGSDTLIGGKGDDLFYVDSSVDVVTELAGEGIDRVIASSNVTLSANVESLTLTGSGLTGRGNGGDNTLSSSSGNTLVGLAGNDVYVINGGNTIIEAAGQGTDTVRSSVSITLGSNLENLVLTGIAAINGTGNTLANSITGNAAANTLNGGIGLDRLVGGAGNDVYVTDGGDAIVEAANQGIDTVRSSVSITLGANLENLVLTGAAVINGTGNTLNNTITGNAAANTLNGGAGKDTLQGGLGGDRLTGGTGRDIFTFGTRLGPTNVDTIADFAVVDDTIRLENSIFTRLATTGSLTAAAFVKNTSGQAADAADRIVYETDTGKLFYDSNGSAVGGSVHFATLAANLALTHADFQVF